MRRGNSGNQDEMNCTDEGRLVNSEVFRGRLDSAGNDWSILMGVQWGRLDVGNSRSFSFTAHLDASGISDDRKKRNCLITSVSHKALEGLRCSSLPKQP